MADDLRDKYLAYYKYPRNKISFPSIINNIKIEPGDLIKLTSSQLKIVGGFYQVLQIDYTPPFPIQNQRPALNLLLQELLYSEFDLTDDVEMSDSEVVEWS